MKMLYNKSLLTVLVFALFGLNSCKDFLEEDNESNFTQDNYFKTPEHAEAILNTMYAGLRFVSDGAGTYGESPFMMLEFPTGTANTEVGQSLYNRNYRNLTANADDNYVNVWWTQSFQSIANANLAIARIPEIDMNEADKQRYIGEAKFMRAFHYFNLVRIFGEVPLLLEPVDANSELLYPQRSPVADVYAAIVKDLAEAEDAGLPLSDDTGRVAEGAVKSLLASVYLTMAGYPLQAGDEYYTMAAEKAKEVMDSGAYALFDDYDLLHDRDVKNTGEFIFQNNYSKGASITNPVTQFLLPRALGISQFSDEIGSIYPTREFIDAQEDGDKRLEEQEFYYTQYPSIDDPNTLVEFSGAYIYKFFDEDAVLISAQSDINWTFLRYAEVLLTYAEAGLEAYGATPEVLDAVNAIRKRADLAPYTSSITAQNIWKERFSELSFENKYWFDMARRRQVLNTETGNWENFVGHQFTYGPTLTEKYLLFPVPQREIDNNTILSQNPGW